MIQRAGAPARLWRRVMLLFALCVGSALARPAAAAGQFIVSSVNPTAITFPTPTSADFDAGFIDRPAVVSVTILTLPFTQGWTLRIRASDPDMGVYGKPVSDLLWRDQTTSPWTPLSASDVVVVNGQGWQSVNLYFRMRLDWAQDGPGSYSTGLTFTTTPR